MASGSRKRRAPGASPQVQQQPALQSNVYTQDTSNMSAEHYLNNWNDPPAAADMSTSFGDPPLFEGMNFVGHGAGQSTNSRIVPLDGLNNGSSGSAVPNQDSYSSQLVRRNPNQQLAARGRTPWDAFNGNSNPNQQGGWENVEDDDEELEQKALLARKDAQAKRKQIPPFVQKLSSFLDEKNNTNLIRWSDDGNSFIVLDEDEFARTLIPELFKHNNYASFVRQLNMYGFHKKVGLSDNSMKASETKAKAPSEYYNKYFKRGRPELLWLIQKPKNPPTGPKRKRDDDGRQGDSDEDRKYAPDGGGGGGYGEDGVALAGNQEMAMIPRTEYNSLRSEVRALQQQQKVISNVLNQIRRQNDQLYQQATAFQTLHERHENSINAILTFLATFYNRSLEANSTANIADMFGPTLSQQQQQPHGNVVDVGDYREKPLNKSPQLHRPVRRPLALLPAPAAKDTGSPTDRAQTVCPSARSTASPISKPTSRQQPVFKSSVQSKPASHATTGFANPVNKESSSTAPLKVDNTEPTQVLGQILEHEIMSAIQSVNAHSGQTAAQAPQFDFPSALTHYQTSDGNVPLTQQQRNQVLSLMANNTSASTNGNLAQNNNNALVTPQPPAMPSLDQFTATQAQLDLLQKMSEDQNSRVQNLQERLQPLSPSGSIPGLTDNSYFGSSNLGEPGAYDLDLDSFVQGDDFFPPSNNSQNATNAAAGDVTLPDLNYELPDTSDLVNGVGFDTSTGAGTSGQEFGSSGLGFDGAGDGGSRIESVSSAATSPAATVEDEVESVDNRSPKRRRK
ncbi:uncharacterized protein BDR25DRAFT_311586 [Lindgomyces ingoldianus]|uniref:Uncharacterized protein n=1 Tax=Lindgomyces ingoldianus TaxID=673940 RepID=A0ACB6R7C3_9PLEO|nr:uncharacterized protein BDR25DRAFT_311586 [Lindgomyces ingoldianus]KAF2474217.1 hypothetical protein BDR25DRAFT_311586 [Lindgomyces ingoldianus]